MTNEAAWNVTPHSDSRMNRMTNIPNTGTVLAGLDKTKHGIFICTADGGSLTKDHVYFCNADGNALIDLSSMAPHTHSGSTDGGDLNDIFRINPTHIDLALTKTQDCQKANWDQTFASGGTAEDKTDGTTAERSIRLRPNTTSGGAASIRYPHLKLDFGKESFYQAKLQLESTSSLAFHTGVRCDLVTSADSNNIKYQAEVCTVTNQNWWLRTADGTANSASDTGIPITTNRTGIRMKFFPGDVVQLTVGAEATLEKASNVASGGETSTNNLITHSIKNSTTADKPLLVYGTRVVYYVSDDWV
jgi:hypothetical protein